jgi:hypothetical protein
LPQPNFEHQHREKKFILAYVKMQSPNIEQSRAALMEYWGGKKPFLLATSYSFDLVYGAKIEMQLW